MAIATLDGPELNEVLKELNAALSEHTRGLREMTSNARFPHKRLD
jgi:hypothetical protein